MLFKGWLTGLQRERLLKKLTHPLALQYMEASLPERHLPIDEVEFLSLDFETTGLNARREAILSMGYTTLKAGRVRLRDCEHHIVRVNFDLPANSVVIHQITDERMQRGMPLHEALDQLIMRMMGRVLLVHYAPIERDFLRAAMKRVYGAELPFLMVDTMQMAYRRLDREQPLMGTHQLRLGNLRRSYGLPRYRAHSALEDAIATAELFLVECSRRPEQSLTLRDVLV